MGTFVGVFVGTAIGTSTTTTTTARKEERNRGSSNNNKHHTIALYFLVHSDLNKKSNRNFPFVAVLMTSQSPSLSPSPFPSNYGW